MHGYISEKYITAKVLVDRTILKRGGAIGFYPDTVDGLRREAHSLANYIDRADSAEECAKIIQNYLNRLAPNNQEIRHLLLQHESWKKKSEHIIRLCLQ